LALEARREAIKRLKAKLPPNFRQGQFMGILGEPNDGKTLLSRIAVWTIASIDEVKGDLSQFLKGDTTFNSDGAHHEVHVTDDEGGKDSPTGQREMGEAIKKSVSQQEKRVHAKGKEGKVVELFNRTVMLLSCGPADMQILPEMTKGIKEKFIMLKSK